MTGHGRMKQARDASAAFLKKLPARAECGLILFDHEVRKKLPAPPNFDRAPLLTMINSTEPRGGTAYLDAGAEAVAMLRAAARGRDRAVVLMTDGIDLNSKIDIKDLINEAVRAKVKVYTIGIGEPGKFEKVNTVLALDHSGSMVPPADESDATPKIIALHEAATRFVESMSPVGRVSIVPFSSNVGKPLPFRDKTKLDQLRTSIKSLEPRGETALFDATYEAICVLDADNSVGKRAVIAMTDGWDNSSRRRVEEVIARAKDAGIALHLLAFGRPGEIDEFTMKLMAKETGGKFYHAKNKKVLIEIFEGLSIDLHDDGIDEDSLKRIAKETGGQYYPAKDVDDLKLAMEKVTKSIQQEPYVVYKSLNQRADGVLRNVTLKLVLRGAAGDEVQSEQSDSYLRRGLVVAEMNHVVYLVLLLVIGCLIALPGLLRRLVAA
jgi:Mg-chelatase subunit ChlD